MTARLVILGATGGTGSQVLEQALAQQRRVTVVVRNPAKLGPVASAVRIVRGDLLTDPAVLDEALADQEAVISALGVGQSFTPNNLIARTCPAVVAAMERQGVRRLVWTSAFGVGRTRRDTPWLPKLFSATLLRRIYADKAAGEAAIEKSNLDWTLVYPVGLTNGLATGSYRASEHLPLSGFPRISRADVADFLLRQVDADTYLRKGVLIASR